MKLPAAVGVPFGGSSLAGGPAVFETPELARIAALPRRSADPTGTLVVAATAKFRAPGGKQTLKPIQALALFELVRARGLFASLQVGSGKTLISVLAPTALGAQRPLLLVPGAHRGKLQHELVMLTQHWQVSDGLHVMTYEKLASASQAGFLESYRPDCVVLDEAHRCKSRTAAVTRRLGRHLKTYPVPVVALTGTAMTKSFTDYAHLLRWCLREKAPVPRYHEEVQRWALAIDPLRDESQRADGRVLAQVLGGASPREAVRERIFSTLGCLRTGASYDGVTLALHAVRPAVGLPTEELLHRLREQNALPNGEEVGDPRDKVRHAKTLALGFYGRWDPPAPEHWLRRRNAWAAAVRAVLEHRVAKQLRLDTPVQVANATLAGKLGSHVANTLAAWAEVRAEYEPNPVAYWVDDSMVRYAADWLARHRGVVFTLDVPFALRLAAETGVPDFGPRARATGGPFKGVTLTQFLLSIEALDGCIASVKSCGEGQNMQLYDRALVVNPPANGKVWEQLLGRLHRTGQSRPVTYDVVQSIPEQVRALDSAVELAQALEEQIGDAQKLLTCERR